MAAFERGADELVDVGHPVLEQVAAAGLAGGQFAAASQLWAVQAARRDPGGTRGSTRNGCTPGPLVGLNLRPKVPDRREMLPLLTGGYTEVDCSGNYLNVLFRELI
jgi:hypothetical protein